MPDESRPPQPRLKDLFARLLDLPEPDRHAALDAAEVSEEIRDEVRGLLESHRQAVAFLPDPHINVERLASRFGRDVSEVIGPYRLLSVLGQGGFGTVYLAEQEKPIRRRVAIKLIRAGMDSAQVTARFDAEREALALMDHPNVARVIDAGTTDNSLPYFVMELVEGKAITTYCDEKRLGTRQRLDLFRDVCAAVHHAHQKGVIHRDLKPSNVMVTDVDDKPVIKVIDFGVAKALHGSGQPALTLDRQFVGTPEYMSPEQAASASDIDTRSDVYGLGVLLYELITGRPPFDPKELRHQAIDEMFRLIREVDPPRPSTRILSEAGSVEIARARGTDPARLKTLLQAELDWIVMCCLAKERDRRYDSAAALSLDVGRFLAGQAIIAHPPTRVYRLQKFARRYRYALAMVGIVVSVLIAGLAIALYGMQEARRERDAAQTARRREADARAVAQQSGTFLRDMFGSIDPELAKGRVVSVREVLDDGALKVSSAFPNQPVAEAAVRDVFAWAYLRIGDEAKSRVHFDIAEQLLQRSADSKDPIRLSVLTGAGETLRGLGKFEESESRLRESLKLQIESAGEIDPETWRARGALCLLLMDRGRYAEALELIDAQLASIQAGAKARSTPVEKLPAWFEARSQRGYVTFLLGHALEAQAMLATLHQDLDKVADTDSGLLTQVLMYQASVEQELNRFAECRAFFEQAAAISERVLGPDHPRTLYIGKEMALVLATSGAPDDAQRRLAALLELARKRFGDDHPFTLGVRNDQVLLMTTWKRDYAAAEPIYLDLAERWGRVMGPDHPNTLYARSSRALALMELDRTAEAEPILREVVARLEAIYGPAHNETSPARVRFARALLRLNRLDESATQYRIAYDAVKAEGRIAQAYQYGFSFGECLVKLGRWADAEPILEETEASMLAFPKQSRVQMAYLTKYLAETYDHTDKPDKAAAARERMERWKAAATRPATTSAATGPGR
jgi:eukaryotic-like serine/threonine-protein kinase